MKKSVKEEPVKEIGIWAVICWILAVFGVIISVFSGIVTIKADQFFIGVLFFVLAIFVFIPRKYLRITSSLKGVIFTILYFVFLIISGMNSPVPEKQYENYSLGQTFNLTLKGNIFSAIIYNTSTEEKIIFNGKETTTSGVYLFVKGGITNLGKIPLDSTFQSELKDDKENLYNLLAVDMSVGSFQPNLEKKFSYVFEIPKDSFGLRLFIKDQSNKTKVIDLDI